jgi:hypothetical protein
VSQIGLGLKISGWGLYLTLFIAGPVSPKKSLALLINTDQQKQKQTLKNKKNKLNSLETSCDNKGDE